jgi:hypothetical protein
MEAYASSPAKDPASIGLAFFDAMQVYDAGIEDENLHTFQETYLCAIQYCWAAGTKKLNGKTLTVAYPRNDMVKSWSKEKHRLAIAPVALVTPTNSPTAANRDIALISTLTEIKESIESSRKSVTKISEESERGFDRLDESLKNLFLKASVLKPFATTPTSPAKFTTEFYHCKNIGRAKTCLENHLRKRQVQWTVNQPLVSAIWNGHVNWDRPEFPSNLSIFFCADASLGTASSYQSKALGLVEKIEHADLAKLIKQHIMLPKTVFDAVMMLKNYYALTAMLFNETS